MDFREFEFGKNQKRKSAILKILPSPNMNQGNMELGKWMDFISGKFLGIELGNNALQVQKERCFMCKKGFKGRCEKRMISKCKEVCKTYDPIQYAYADVLQKSGEIKEIRCNVILEGYEYRN